MSDDLQHECGVTCLRLRRNLNYYVRKYGSPYYGFQKLALLLEKQHNRGQDGAGMACVRIDAAPGEPFYQLRKSCGELPLAELLGEIGSSVTAALANFSDAAAAAAAPLRELPFCGELYLGHLRYGTFGRRTLDACHPVVRESSWRNHTLMLAGNFNLTNTAAIFAALAESGHHLQGIRDNEVMLAQLVHCLEKMAQPEHSTDSFDIAAMLRIAAAEWDGGFVVSGLFGNGDLFAIRDAAGIRPAYYYFDDEIAVVASERPAIQTAFDLPTAEVNELPPGYALITTRDGAVTLQRCLPERPPRRCVFERIYFSRGNDAEIHRERRALGRALVPAILDAVGNDYENTVFSYIPNTALISYHGVIEELSERAPGRRVRFGQIAVKDAKFRTFITDPGQRRELFAHVYDVTYGVIRPGSDNLVVIDDSIVRGNTMRNAILPMLDRLGPKKIVVASSAPPLCYPDCYGIDVAGFGELIAFEAIISLLRRKGRASLLDECVALARADLSRPDFQMLNRALPLYSAASSDELADEICRLLRPPELKAELKIIFQSRDALRECCPKHAGDWYFSGDYPTPGGNRVVNRALVNYYDQINERAY